MPVSTMREVPRFGDRQTAARPGRAVGVAACGYGEVEIAWVGIVPDGEMGKDALGGHVPFHHGFV